MENVVNTYCRFCAKLKNPSKVLNLQNDGQKCDEVLLKLAFMNALYVDVNNDTILPKTVCFVCYNSLNKAYEFLLKVKHSQEVLSTLLSSNEDFNAVNKSYVSDDDGADNFDDIFLNNDAEDCSALVKQESPPRRDVPHNNPNIYQDLNIKDEPKEEMPDPNAILDAVMGTDNTIENFNSESLNVQDIIEAAMSNTSLSSNIKLYAKDISELSKKDINTWRDYPWVCAFCNIEFIDMEMLRSHAKVVHGKCSAFMCVDCKIVRKDTFTSFIKHIRKHRKNLRYEI